MATMKRRVVYLSDEEWEDIKDQALAADMTASMYLRQIVKGVSMGLTVQRPLRDDPVRFNSQPFAGPIPKVKR